MTTEPDAATPATTTLETLDRFGDELVLDESELYKLEEKKRRLTKSKA